MLQSLLACVRTYVMIVLSRPPRYTEHMTLSISRCISSGGDKSAPSVRQSRTSGNSKRLDSMKPVASPTPALRHAAAQHRGALYVRSAQVGQQVCICDELRGAALHAARVGSVACYVPLLKHGHVGVAVQRHAIGAPVHK